MRDINIYRGSYLELIQTTGYLFQARFTSKIDVLATIFLKTQRPTQGCPCVYWYDLYWCEIDVISTWYRYGINAYRDFIYDIDNVAIQYRYCIDQCRYSIDVVSIQYRYSLDTLSIQYPYSTDTVYGKLTILNRYSLHTVSIKAYETVPILYRYSIELSLI